jgi:hypothetical protein
MRVFEAFGFGRMITGGMVSMTAIALLTGCAGRPNGILLSVAGAA